MQVDILVAAFVNSADAITELKGLLGEKGKKIAIIANIQTNEGFRNYDAILAVSYISNIFIHMLYNHHHHHHPQLDFTYC